MERERGISITSTVLQFPYKGHVVNLLDTPGHQDFSEDTYRTLTAADSAVMVLDAAKGVEAQTLKLFHVCRQRGIPIFTFINKMDRPSEDPLGFIGWNWKCVANATGANELAHRRGEQLYGGVSTATAKMCYLYDRTARNQTDVARICDSDIRRPPHWSHALSDQFSLKIFNWILGCWMN